MQAIQLTSDPKSFNIRLDKKYFDREMLHELLDELRIEYLVSKAEFNEEIEKIGEEIKASWWKENKQRLLKGSK